MPRAAAALLTTVAGHLLSLVMLVLTTFAVLAIPRIDAAVRFASPELRRAELDSRQAIDTQLSALDAFFAGAKERTPVFAKDALGLQSTLSLLQGDLEKHLRSSFEQHVFSEEQLKKEIQNRLVDYFDTVRRSESEVVRS